MFFVSGIVLELPIAILIWHPEVSLPCFTLERHKLTKLYLYADDFLEDAYPVVAMVARIVWLKTLVKIVVAYATGSGYVPGVLGCVCADGLPRCLRRLKMSER